MSADVVGFSTVVIAEPGADPVVHHTVVLSDGSVLAHDEHPGRIGTWYPLCPLPNTSAARAFAFDQACLAEKLYRDHMDAHERREPWAEAGECDVCDHLYRETAEVPA